VTIATRLGSWSRGPGTDVETAPALTDEGGAVEPLKSTLAAGYISALENSVVNK